jgi:DNA-binding transcriptional regulator GbsR (MarR family)
VIYRMNVTKRFLLGMLVGGDAIQAEFDAHRDVIEFLINERREKELEEVRRHRDLIAQFSAALENDDQDALRDALRDAFSDLSDHVARLEEHAG